MDPLRAPPVLPEAWYVNEYVGGLVVTDSAIKYMYYCLEGDSLNMITGYNKLRYLIFLQNWDYLAAGVEYKHMPNGTLMSILICWFGDDGLIEVHEPLGYDVENWTVYVEISEACPYEVWVWAENLAAGEFEALFMTEFEGIPNDWRAVNWYLICETIDPTIYSHQVIGVSYATTSTPLISDLKPVNLDTANIIYYPANATSIFQVTFLETGDYIASWKWQTPRLPHNPHPEIPQGGGLGSKPKLCR